MVRKGKSGWVVWSEDEIKLLKRLFPLGKAGQVVEKTGRPLTAVRQKAYSMGIRSEGYNPWSPDEIELLKKLYQTEDAKNISNRLGRPVQSIGDKARSIGLNPTTPF